MEVEEDVCDDKSVLEREVLRSFIKVYERLPVLWNPTDPGYLNKSKRIAALDKLNSIYIQCKPGATRADVRRKINTLRCNYRKELKKIEDSMRCANSSDDIYQPTSWVFYALQFISQFEQPLHPSIRRQPDETHNATEVNETKDIPTIKLEDALVHSQFLPTGNTPPQAFQQVIKRQRTMGPVARQSDLLQKVCTYLKSSRKCENDSTPHIAKAWGEKLLTLEPQQRLLAEKAVNDVLFEASQGNLHRNSVKIN